MKRIWLILSWAGAAALVAFIAFQGLSAAQGGVNDRPLTPVVVAATQARAIGSTPQSANEAAPAASTSTPTTPSSSITSGGSTDGSVGGTGDGTTTTTVAGETPDTSSTSTTVTSTTSIAKTTTTETAWTRTTISSPGGSVTVSYRPGEVRYEAGTPAAGFQMEIDETSPEVRVEFASDELSDYEIRARWTSDGFDSEINEKG